MRRSSPRPLGEALDALLEQTAPATLLVEAMRAWPDAVGPAVAREATPVSERDGVLTVSCSSSVWAHELDLLSETVLAGLASVLGPDRIRRLRCVATPPPEAR